MQLLLIVAFALWSIISLARVGVWDKSLSVLSFEPAFVLLKVGSFGRSGQLTSFPMSQHFKRACSTHRIEAWVAHRLSPNERLDAKTAQGVASHLNALESCVRAVELDIEPLPSPPLWLGDFLVAMRKVLKADMELRIAVPMISRRSLPNGLSWTSQQLEGVLQSIEGADIMAYDTGLKTPQEYSALLKESISDLLVLLAKNPLKNIVVGLPSYYDVSLRHQPHVENAMVATAAIRQLGPRVCHPKLRFSFYLGQTMTNSDQGIASELKKWVENECRD